MLTPPTGLDEGDVVDALARFWALEVDHLDYIPQGFGSYHWRTGASGERYFLTVDDLDTKPWLGTTREATFEGLRGVYDAAFTLHRRGKLGFVVAPIPGVDGGTAFRLSDRHVLSVFPFLGGQAGVWGQPIDQSDREQLLRHLAELHQADAVALPVPRHGLVVPGRAELESALKDRNQPWTGGPLSEPARQLLAREAETVQGWFDSFDHLAGLVERAGGPSVVTHGEPHPANLIRSDGGFFLVDWDTMGLARPERDLWMLDDGSSDSWAAYVEASGRKVDETAVALFRLAWVLSDLAVCTMLFRSAHDGNDDTEESLRAFSDSLSGTTTTSPYGV